MLDTKSSLDLIRPVWPAPSNVRAFTTTRNGGFSQGPWSSLNLGDNCGDDIKNVKKNRQGLLVHLPNEPQWLKQVHGRRVVNFNELTDAETEADAVVAAEAGQVCSILHADCLPVLFCNEAGTQIAAAHAGWRGLASGVLATTVSAMACKPDELIAWMGPAIGPQAFEVGQEVYDSFVSVNAENKIAFNRHGDRWLADLYKLARLALSETGIEKVFGGQYCTYTEKDQFFSYRRDGQSGRMATLIWLVK